MTRRCLAALLVVAPGLWAQVVAQFSPQVQLGFLTPGGIERVTEWSLVLCNQDAASGRQVLGPEIFDRFGKHARYLTLGTLRGWASGAQQVRAGLLRTAGYVLFYVGFAGTSAQAGGLFKIRDPRAVALLPVATAAVGAASKWLSSNPPKAWELPQNVVPGFIKLSPAGQPGACAENTYPDGMVVFSITQQGESMFEERW